MNTEKFIEMFLYMIPAIITGGIAYYFFKQHIENEFSRRQFLIKKGTCKKKPFHYVFKPMNGWRFF